MGKWIGRDINSLLGIREQIVVYFSISWCPPHPIHIFFFSEVQDKRLRLLLKVAVGLSLYKPWRNIGGVDVQLHTFLTLALDGGESLTSRSSWCTPGKENRCPLHRSVSGPWRWCGIFLKKKKSLAPIGIGTPEGPVRGLVTFQNPTIRKVTLKRTLCEVLDCR